MKSVAFGIIATIIALTAFYFDVQAADAIRLYCEGDNFNTYRCPQPDYLGLNADNKYKEFSEAMKAHQATSQVLAVMFVPALGMTAYFRYKELRDDGTLRTIAKKLDSLKEEK